MKLFSNKSSEPEEEKFAITRKSFTYIGIGVMVIVIGFLLMLGGKAEDPASFNEAVFSFRRITLAPMIVLAGFLFIIWAIMRKPKSSD